LHAGYISLALVDLRVDLNKWSCCNRQSGNVGRRGRLEKESKEWRKRRRNSKTGFPCDKGGEKGGEGKVGM